jgi:hypothetical protein
MRVVESRTDNTAITWHDQSPGYEALFGGPMDPSRSSADDSDISHADFFKRPVKIRTISWQVNQNLNDSFDPYLFWSGNPAISNRLNHFRNFRGDLKIKVVVNGNAFFWGLGISSWYPQGGWTGTPPWHFKDPDVDGDIMLASQRQHILLDATSSQGGEMTIPFFYASDNADLNTGGMGNVGDLWTTSVTPLKHPTSSNPLTISIYAWCENVVLSAPTQTNWPGLNAQAGEHKTKEHPDEYAKGPISKPAAAVAKAAGMMKGVPIIGKYALATQEAAKTVGKIASWFGYCKPRVVSDTMRVNLNQGLELATIDTQDTSVSLAFNAKRELTIDPAIAHGGSEDELSFEALASRPSILARAIEWLPQTATDFPIISFPVTPALWYKERRSTLPSNSEIVTLTPSAFVAVPFRFWRGTMKVRVQVVASSFHKGRLLVSWDAHQPISPVATETVRSQVMDIAETRDFTFEVGWTAPTAGLIRDSLAGTDSTYTVGNVYTMSPGQHNGIITISIMNTLTQSQETTEPVYINVWTSFSNLEVWCPDSNGFNLYTPFQDAPTNLVAQAGEVNAADIEQEDPNPPVEVDADDAMGGDIELAEASFLHGDPISSFRTCLKRYTLEEVIPMTYPPVTAPDEYSYADHTRPMKPLYRGPQSAAISYDPLTNATKWDGPLTLLAYVSQCFTGFRGGLRYKFIPDCGTSNTQIATVHENTPVTVCRTPYSAGGAFQGTYSTLQELYTYQDNSWSGEVMSNQVNKHVMEVELPWYSRSRFEPVYTTQTYPTGNDYRIQSVRYGVEGGMKRHFRKYVAGADDFTLVGFRGAPQMALWTTIPN